MNELQMPQFFDKHFFIVLTQNELYLNRNLVFMGNCVSPKSILLSGKQIC